MDDMIETATAARERYQRDLRFRATVQGVVCHVMREHGPVDPERADREASDIATKVAAMLLERVFQDDAELNAQRHLAEQYKKIDIMHLTKERLEQIPGPDRPALTEAEIHYASEVASVVRSAVYSAAKTPEWGNDLIIGVGPLCVGEVIEAVECGLCPVRREPRGELVWVRFDTSRDVTPSDDLKAAILREIAPFIVGVGEVVAEDTPEGFKVFRLDDRKELSGHTGPLDVTPEMIEAGSEAILSRTGGADLGGWFSPDELAQRVYQAMAAAGGLGRHPSDVRSRLDKLPCLDSI